MIYILLSVVWSGREARAEAGDQLCSQARQEAYGLE